MARLEMARGYPFLSTGQELKGNMGMVPSTMLKSMTLARRGRQPLRMARVVNESFISWLEMQMALPVWQ